MRWTIALTKPSAWIVAELRSGQMQNSEHSAIWRLTFYYFLKAALHDAECPQALSEADSLGIFSQGPFILRATTRAI
jgi:hypothetical protein